MEFERVGIFCEMRADSELSNHAMIGFEFVRQSFYDIQYLMYEKTSRHG